MTVTNPSDTELKSLLTEAATIAIVGASSRPDRASHGIMRRLLHAGYRVVPVNPNESDVLGQRAYPRLEDVPHAIDIVNVFRRPEATPAVAASAVGVGAKALWLQSGIVNDEAARIARKAGLTVVMDACIGVMHSMLRIVPKQG